ncbi:uncharacterized protein AstC [Procambarus clarkii]|uniref:uncharacterized protein AstC n=1 Tax=Procambarus clarkii TaxID=6728 RepID=UPI001E676D20|nr:uncharacterized protein LOC123767809 [Procambarus clarkii]
MHCSAHLLLVALAVVHALPAPNTRTSSLQTPSANHDPRIQKRAVSSDPNEEEIAVLKDLILARVASELQDSLQEVPTLKKILSEEEQQQQQQGEEVKRKRMFVPLSGLPGELPTIKRQIRYHQCYFNPISCFRRK